MHYKFHALRQLDCKHINPSYRRICKFCLISVQCKYQNVAEKRLLKNKNPNKRKFEYDMVSKQRSYIRVINSAIIISGQVPQAPGSDTDPLVTHLTDRHLNHDLIPRNIHFSCTK